MRPKRGAKDFKLPRGVICRHPSGTAFSVSVHHRKQPFHKPAEPRATPLYGVGHTHRRPKAREYIRSDRKPESTIPSSIQIRQWKAPRASCIVLRRVWPSYSSLRSPCRMSLLAVSASCRRRINRADDVLTGRRMDIPDPDDWDERVFGLGRGPSLGRSPYY